MLGILGGTSFLGLEQNREATTEEVQTGYGPTTVLVADTFAMIARHGAGGYLPPHKINHHAHLKAFEELDVDRIVSFGSVGSLKALYQPGTILVPDDCFAPFRVMTFQEDTLRFVVPGFDEEWRNEVLHTLRDSDLHAVDGGIYAETTGPRFETPSEIRFLSDYADVVGMTCASEAFLANELDIPQVIIAVVDNYANGIGAEPLTGEAFQAQVKANQDRAVTAFEAVLRLA
ncbi:5'-methylthioadenosine phosphorylase [bacterium]|nr:5'-methylthioadenosine phosphorylase [bacterium]